MFDSLLFLFPLRSTDSDLHSIYMEICEYSVCEYEILISAVELVLVFIH